MKTKLSLLASGILLALSGASSAQAAGLAQIYDQARSNDPQLLAAQAESLAGQEAAPISKGALYPNITLVGETERTDRSTGNTNANGATLSLSQPLFDLNKWYSYERAETLTEQAKLVLEIAEQGLIVRVVSAYLDVLQAEFTLEVAESRERALKRRLDQVNAQFEVGLIAITDVLEARASYDDALVGVIDAKGDLANRFEALERLSGSPIGFVDVLSPDYPIEAPDETDAEAWVSKALGGNISLRSAKLSETAATQNVKAVEATGLPTLSLGVSAREGNDNYETFDNVVGLTLSIPLFRGGSITAEKRRAAFQEQQTMFEFEDAARQVSLDTRSLLRDLETSVASVAARIKSIESREKALEATEQGFQVGTRNVVDVLDAENALYEAQQAYNDARIAHVKTLFEFKRQVGTLSPEDLMALDQWMIENDRN